MAQHMDFVSSDESTASRGTNSTFPLDPDGDLVLAINGSNGTQEQFLVCSTILRLGSPYFAAMFASSLKEGAELRNGKIPTISIEDDDPEAMSYILRILHHQCAGVPLSIGADALATLAIQCDKYQCSAPLQSWIMHWCNNVPNVSSAEDVGLVLLAAYMFRSQTFASISAKAVRLLTPDFLTAWESHETLRLLPDTVATVLFDEISCACMAVHQEIQATEGRLREEKLGYALDGFYCMQCGRNHPSTAKKCHPCNNSELHSRLCTSDYRVSEYFAILRRGQLWPSVTPLSTCALADIAWRVESLQHDHKHKCAANSTCPLIVELKNLAARVQGVLKNLKGVAIEKVF